MKKACFALLVVLLLSTGCTKNENFDADIVFIDGVKHVQNPGQPIKGTILLELKKVREINPFEREDVGMRLLFSTRSPKGEVILYDPNNIEAHRWGPDNSYLGSMVKKGQGPGEFQQYRGLSFHFVGEEIWAASSEKVARFDRSGAYLDEYKIDYVRGRPEYFIGRDRYLCERSERTESAQKRLVCLDYLPGERAEAEAIVFFEVSKQEWMVRRGQSAFADSWCCPSLLFTFSPKFQTVFYALNQEYEIFVKDTAGNMLHIIEKPHQPVKVGLKEKEMLAEWALDNEQSRWILDAYPDMLNALYGLKALPNGLLAALRISGAKEVTIDIFDHEGRWLYALELPKDQEGRQMPHETSRMGFFESGIFAQEIRDDLPVYVEYQITNAPDVFQ